MEYGKIKYSALNAGNGNGAPPMKLTLTLIGQGDEEFLRESGLAGLRRKRVLRLAREAFEQGSPLGYEDLSALLLTSLATLKRDIGHLEGQGHSVPLRGRKKNGKRAHARMGRAR